MAYVPDDAMRCKRDITHSAWDVYEALCSFADPDTGIVESRHAFNLSQRQRHQRLVEFTALKLGTVKNALMELRKEGWIEERAERVYHLVGTFLNDLREWKRTPPQPSPVSDATSPGNASASPHSDAPSPVSDGRVDKDRARGSDQTRPNRPDQTTTLSSAPRSTVREVFEYWRETMNHPQAKLTPERERAVSARLRDGYTVEQIKQAIDGCGRSPFHRGENDRQQRYDDLTLICRNGAKLESFIERGGTHEKPDGRSQASGGDNHAEAGGRQPTREERIRADLIGLSEQVRFTGTASALDG